MESITVAMLRLVNILVLVYFHIALSRTCPAECRCKHASNRRYVIACNGQKLTSFPRFNYNGKDLENVTSVDLYLNENEIAHILVLYLNSFRGKLRVLELQRNRRSLLIPPTVLDGFAGSLKVVKIDNIATSVNQALQLLTPLKNLHTLKISTSNTHRTGLQRFFSSDTRLDRLKNYSGGKDVYPNLRALQLCNCDISTVAKDAFYDFSALTSLSLAHNVLTSVPRALDHLFVSNLEELDLGYNRIETLSDSDFPHLCKLRVLNLESNELVRIDPFSFSKCPMLCEISVASNARLASVKMCPYTLGSTTTTTITTTSSGIKLDISKTSVPSLHDGISLTNSGGLREVIVEGSIMPCDDSMFYYFWKFTYRLKGTCKAEDGADVDIWTYLFLIPGRSSQVVEEQVESGGYEYNEINEDEAKTKIKTKAGRSSQVVEQVESGGYNYDAINEDEAKNEIQTKTKTDRVENVEDENEARNLNSEETGSAHSNAYTRGASDPKDDDDADDTPRIPVQNPGPDSQSTSGEGFLSSLQKTAADFIVNLRKITFYSNSDKTKDDVSAETKDKEMDDLEPHQRPQPLRQSIVVGTDKMNDPNSNSRSKLDEERQMLDEEKSCDNCQKQKDWLWETLMNRERLSQSQRATGEETTPKQQQHHSSDSAAAGCCLCRDKTRSDVDLEPMSTESSPSSSMAMMMKTMMQILLLDKKKKKNKEEEEEERGGSSVLDRNRKSPCHLGTTLDGEDERKHLHQDCEDIDDPLLHKASVRLASASSASSACDGSKKRGFGGDGVFKGTHTPTPEGSPPPPSGGEKLVNVLHKNYEDEAILNNKAFPDLDVAESESAAAACDDGKKRGFSQDDVFKGTSTTTPEGIPLSHVSSSPVSSSISPPPIPPSPNHQEESSCADGKETTRTTSQRPQQTNTQKHKTSEKEEEKVVQSQRPQQTNTHHQSSEEEEEEEEEEVVPGNAADAAAADDDDPKWSAKLGEEKKHNQQQSQTTTTTCRQSKVVEDEVPPVPEKDGPETSTSNSKFGEEKNSDDNTNKNGHDLNLNQFVQQGRDVEVKDPKGCSNCKLYKPCHQPISTTTTTTITSSTSERRHPHRPTTTTSSTTTTSTSSTSNLHPSIREQPKNARMNNQPPPPRQQQQPPPPSHKPWASPSSPSNEIYQHMKNHVVNVRVKNDNAKTSSSSKNSSIEKDGEREKKSTPPPLPATLPKTKPANENRENNSHSGDAHHDDVIKTRRSGSGYGAVPVFLASVLYAQLAVAVIMNQGSVNLVKIYPSIEEHIKKRYNLQEKEMKRNMIM